MNNASIHIHPRRVWLWLSIHVFTSSLFQSTHPRRVWLLSSSLKSATKNVSIHTPTQGVTHLRLPQRLIPMFQSTHPRRVWQKWNALLLKVRLFQSTHPRRVWPNIVAVISHIFGFNPHTHAGCDLIVIVDSIKEEFQSTHPRRVWLELPEDLTGIVVSIHTPTQGVTQDGQWYQMTIDGFNPHTHAGCDRKHLFQKLGSYVSIHTPTQGVTGNTCTIVLIRNVSIHTPTQGVTLYNNIL